MAREKYLDKIAGRKPKLWIEVEALVATTKPNNYDQAVKLLLDLRDLDARVPEGDFHGRLTALWQAHAGKPSFIKRLKKVNL